MTPPRPSRHVRATLRGLILPGFALGVAAGALALSVTLSLTLGG